MTRKWLLCTATAFALAATPALAVNESENSSASGSASPASRQDANNAIDKALSERNANAGNQASDASSSDDAGPSASNRNSNPHRNVRAMTQQRLRGALEEAGFRQIRVLDAQYLIQAKDENGNTVFMAINPPSTDRGSMNRSQTTGSGGGDQSSASPRSGANDSRGYSSGGGRWNSDSAYNSAYDQGFREGYNRGYDNGAGFGYGR